MIHPQLLYILVVVFSRSSDKVPTSIESAIGKITNLSGHHACLFLFKVTVVAGPKLDMVA